jgi:hypothetical protein
VSDELLVTFERGRKARILVIPALFDEANKMRRFTLDVMRALDEAGIDSALPDWPGCNESVAPMATQTLERWRACAVAAMDSFRATHVLSVRAGALIAPPDSPGWRYAAVDGPKVLSGLLRAQTIAAREAGADETRQGLMARGREHGLMLGGWELGPTLLRELESATLAPQCAQHDVEQSALAGSGLWLRAEAGEDADQAAALATIIAGPLLGDEGGAS